MKNNTLSMHDEYLATKFFPSLDGLRAIAVGLVFSVHFGGAFGAAVLGRVGVQAFFVLSGFLITTLLLREYDRRGSIDLRAFYVRRVFRIMPAYYFVLALVIWQTRHLDDWWGPFKGALPYYLTMSGESFVGQAPWQIAWSLGVEWKFYMIWPPLAFLLARTMKGRFLAAFVVMLAGFYFWQSHFLIRDYIQLLYGALLAMLMHSRRSFRLVEPLMRPGFALLVFVAFLVMQSQAGKLAAHFELATAENLYSLAVAFLIPAILAPRGLPFRILSSRPFEFIGRRSYSMYLIQPFAQQAVSAIVPWHADNIWDVIQIYIVALVFSDVTFRYIEQPCIALGSRIIKRWKTEERFGVIHTGSTTR